MNAIKDKVATIRKRYEDKTSFENKQKQQSEIMTLYKKENVIPIGGAAEGLIFAPLSFVMFIVIRSSRLLKISGTEDFSLVTTIWTEVQKQSLSYYLIPIAIYLVLFVINHLVLARMLKPKLKHKPIKVKNKNQSFLKGPIFQWKLKILFLVFFVSVPVGLSIYWIFTSLFEIIQKLLMAWLRKIKKEKDIAKKRGQKFTLWKPKFFGEKTKFKRIFKKISIR